MRHKTLACSKKRQEFQHQLDFWRAYANLVRARRQRGVWMWARFLAPTTTLALWLALGAVSAQPQPQSDEAFQAFGELLAVSQRAAAPYSHYRVTLASWRDAQAAWERASAALPAPAQGLRRCVLPLQKARGLVEQAHQLFHRARESFGSQAVELLLEHEELQKQAEGPLQEAEACYRAARNAYSP